MSGLTCVNWCPSIFRKKKRTNAQQKKKHELVEKTGTGTLTGGGGVIGNGNETVRRDRLVKRNTHYWRARSTAHLLRYPRGPSAARLKRHLLAMTHDGDDDNDDDDDD